MWTIAVWIKAIGTLWWQRSLFSGIWKLHVDLLWQEIVLGSSYFGMILDLSCQIANFPVESDFAEVHLFYAQMIKFWNINYSYHFSPDELMNLFTWLIQNQKQCIFVWFWMQKIIIDMPIPKRQQKYSILSIKSNTNMIIVKRESESYKENWNLGKFDSVEEFLKKS